MVWARSSAATEGGPFLLSTSHPPPGMRTATAGHLRLSARAPPALGPALAAPQPGPGGDAACFGRDGRAAPIALCPGGRTTRSYCAPLCRRGEWETASVREKYR